MKKIVVVILVALCLISTLVACTQKEPKVTFMVDGEVYKEVLKSEISEVEQPKKDNYLFEGWFFDNGEWKNPLKASEIKADSVVFAKFVVDPLITFIVDEDVYQTSLKSKISYLIEPTKNDYIFEGWYFDNDLWQEPVNFNEIVENCSVYAKFVAIEKFKLTYKFCDDHGIIGSEIYNANQVVDLPIIENGQYFLGWMTEDGQGPFKQINVDRDMTLTPVFSNLDRIYIDTNGAPILDKENYVNATFTMLDKNGDVVDTFKDLSTGIRLRGNSTYYYSKKPYRIKFDKKQALLGDIKYKSWVLLADMLDPTLIKNYSAHYLASNMDGIGVQIRTKHVQLFVNGEEMGVYLLTDQVQEQPAGSVGRVPIEIDEEEISTMTEIPFLLERDYYPEGVENQNWFKYQYKDLSYNVQIKYPDNPTDEQFNFIYNTYDVACKMFIELRDANESEKEQIRLKISEKVDINSIIDYFLILQIMHEADYGGSMYMYYDKEKLRFGPIWDFDGALVNQGGESCRFEKYFIAATNELPINLEWYQIMREDSIFNKQICERFNTAGKQAMEKLINHLDSYFDYIYFDGMRNIILWSDSQKNLHFANKYADYGKYSEAKEFIIKWFELRLNFLLQLYAVN